VSQTLTSAPSRRAACRHCSRLRVPAGRGLCPSCHRTPGLREQYRPLKDCGEWADREPPAPTLPAAEPTDAMPGSEAKVLTLIARREAGEHLYHPRDMCQNGRGLL
jgi:hypothetical protein